MKKLFINFIALVFSFLVNNQIVMAATVDLDDSSDVTNKKETIERSGVNKEIKSKKSAEDLFGDEQTFPFVAGLGKNAAH
tara:strand:+ start:1646 stop:1885 length:240 start_codon:yes stop_codon:yes gene_type:complete